MQMRVVIHFLATLLLLSFLPAGAEMIPPHDKTYWSNSKHYQFQTILERSGDNTVVGCHGVLSTISQNGSSSTIWSVPLFNPNGPSEVLLCNDGQYVVTLRDWFPRAEENFVVIYGKKGSLIRRFSLTDLLRETNTNRPPPDTLRHGSDGIVLGRPWIDQAHIDDSNDTLSFIFRVRRKADSEKLNREDNWESKQETIVLSTGRFR
jgi:hypothetical protein